VFPSAKLNRIMIERSCALEFVPERRCFYSSVVNDLQIDRFWKRNQRPTGTDNDGSPRGASTVKVERSEAINTFTARGER
jgi:hypothetical protein